MEKKCNIQVRECARLHDVPLWKVADLMKISYSTLMWRLRHEWPEEELGRVVALIEEYVDNADEQA